jgi:hypothetical protein
MSLLLRLFLSCFQPPMSSPRLPLAVALACGLVLAGCLPSSCRPTESRALLPADSLARQLAARVPVDTLRLVWEAAGEGSNALRHPRTVLAGHDGRWWVSDFEPSRLVAFDSAGVSVEAVQDDALAYPYLIGQRADTLVLFSPGSGQVQFVADGRVVHHFATPAGPFERGTLQYAVADRGGVWLKVVPEDREGSLARLDDQGQVRAQTALTGPHWRHAGPLRMWEDTLLSLCGYRPVADRWYPDGRRDSLVLAGFDSPMLARSRLFLTGEIHEAPLLSATAVPVGERLFVLNMRPGWLQVDVYDRSGRLQRVLVQPNPDFNQQFYPVDLAVRPLARGYALAVLTHQPNPRLRRYDWNP